MADAPDPVALRSDGLGDGEQGGELAHQGRPGTVVRSPGKRSTYMDSLDDAENLRKQIASKAQYDLTLIEFDPYGDVAATQPPAPTDVDREAAARIIERWAKVAGRSQVPATRAKEHRALLDLVSSALATLETEPATDPELLKILMRMLRFARQMTPASAATLRHARIPLK